MKLKTWKLVGMLVLVLKLNVKICQVYLFYFYYYYFFFFWKFQFQSIKQRKIDKITISLQLESWNFAQRLLLSLTIFSLLSSILPKIKCRCLKMKTCLYKNHFFLWYWNNKKLHCITSVSWKEEISEICGSGSWKTDKVIT